MIFYANFRLESGNGRIRLGSGRVALLLVGEAYEHDVCHRRRSDVLGEVTGVGYAEGGMLLPHQVWRQHPETFAGELRADPCVWRPATLRGVRGGVLYERTGPAPGDDPLIAYFPFAEELSCSGWGELRVDWDPAGVLRLE